MQFIHIKKISQTICNKKSPTTGQLKHDKIIIIWLYLHILCLIVREFTISRYIQKNSENLTKYEALLTISQFTGLPFEELIEEVEIISSKNQNNFL
jgi:hypothetical protein